MWIGGIGKGSECIADRWWGNRQKTLGGHRVNVLGDEVG